MKSRALKSSSERKITGKKMKGVSVEPGNNEVKNAGSEEESNNVQNHQQNNEEQQPRVRELTQTDTLNKILLVSLKNRMASSSEEYQKYMEKPEEDNNKDFEDS